MPVDKFVEAMELFGKLTKKTTISSDELNAIMAGYQVAQKK